ncbi:MAG: hypothetical protein BucCj_2910 [Buchnera aphidicola (Ceratovacuna japonica)]
MFKIQLPDIIKNKLKDVKKNIYKLILSLDANIKQEENVIRFPKPIPGFII